MHIGIAADHGGFDLKQKLIKVLKEAGHRLEDFGAYHLAPDDDYPDFVLPLARALSRGEVNRGIAICGSGVGACIAANKVPGVRAGQVTESFSAHQGVEDDDMNMICLGARVVGHALALELVDIFLNADFKAEERFQRRLNKVNALERDKRSPKEATWSG